MSLQHEIADLAYELYVNSGYVEGRDIENWLEAERIILARERLKGDEPVERKKKRVVRSKSKKTKKEESNIS